MRGGRERDEQARRVLLARQLLLALGKADGPPDDSLSLAATLATPGVAETLLEPGPGDQTWLPVFTSTEEALRWRPSARMLEASGEELLVLAEQLGCSEVVIDPAGPQPVRVPAGRGQAVGGTARRSTSVRPLSSPLGHDVLRRLDRELAGNAAINRVWLVELALEGEDLLLVGVEVLGADPAEAHRLADSLRPRITPLLPGALYDGVEFRALTEAGFAADVAAADAPVYRRRPG
jgi:hypothetical protein